MNECEQKDTDVFREMYIRRSHAVGVKECVREREKRAQNILQKEKNMWGTKKEGETRIKGKILAGE